MRKKIAISVGVSVVFLTVGISFGKSWTTKMHSLNQTLAGILPDLLSDKAFEDPKKRKELTKKTQKLSKLAHDLVKFSESTKSMPSDDPTLKFILTTMDTELERASLHLKDGNRNYARRKLRTITSYCINCHTRGNQGLEYLDNNVKNLNVKLTPMERADYLTATRRFTQALKIYRQVIKDKDLVKKDRITWGVAMQRALQISIRVKGDAAESLQIINDAKSMKGIGNETNKLLVSWAEAVKSWQREERSSHITDDQLLKETRRLVTLAEKSKTYPADQSADIHYMRASSVAHELLQQTKSPAVQAEGLYLAGKSYEAINDVGIWDLHEMMYESCIRTLPHTRTSESCFKNLRESIENGFTGSAGMDIPPGINRQLKQLKKLAQRSKKK